MRIFVTGATGFVGKVLLERLAGEGHDAIAWVRDPDRARRALGRGVELVPIDQDPAGALATSEAVVNLAGEPVVGRWSKAKKSAMIESRVGLTRRLVDAIGRASPAPSALVSASAVGYYGDGGDTVLAESSPPGHDFLATLCRDWEAAALGAERHGLRVALIRIGVVLGHGGALDKMLPPFKAGVGGRIGSGEQYMPWIHVEDLVELFATALRDARYRGPINGTAPSPITNEELTRTLAELLHRPAIVPVPAFALKLIFGEGATMLMTGQRAVPERARELGFAYRFPELQGALRSLL